MTTVTSTVADQVRVLVVEDEFLLADELNRVVRGLGCTVVGPVADVEAALALAREAAIDLAILDVRIRGGDSTPVAEVLAARGCPFLFATGYGTDDVPWMMWKAPVLTKPLQQSALAEALKHLLPRG